MKTRSTNKRKDVKSGCGGSSTATGLDENLWGTLQYHVNVAENVYSKLPFEEFFRLRTVCKDWYNIACKRLALKEQIRKPFFTLFTKGIGGRLNGILFYNASSGAWDWETNWIPSRGCQFVASEGVVYHHYNWSFDVPVEESSRAGAFHWQSRMYQNLHAPPVPPSFFRKTILGMSISEKRDSFSSFRLVCGSQDFDTQVYESGVWQTKPCRVPKPETGGDLQTSTGCVDCNGRVYITTEWTREMFIYDFEKASWSSLPSPCNWVFSQPQHYCPDTLGAWNGRVFDVTDDYKLQHRTKTRFLSVWELVDETLHRWKIYDRMPKDLYSWLRSSQGFRPVNIKASDISIQASFCGDYMLAYAWDRIAGAAGRFCLFCMATKNWEKLEIPMGTLEIFGDSSSDDSDPETSDDSDSENSDEIYDVDAFESSLDEFMVEDDDDDSELGF